MPERFLFGTAGFLRIAFLQPKRIISIARQVVGKSENASVQTETDTAKSPESGTAAQEQSVSAVGEGSGKEWNDKPENTDWGK